MTAMAMVLIVAMHMIVGMYDSTDGHETGDDSSDGYDSGYDS